MSIKISSVLFEYICPGIDCGVGFVYERDQDDFIQCSECGQVWDPKEATHLTISHQLPPEEEGN